AFWICKVLGFQDDPNGEYRANAEFIAAARTGWPRALRELERLRVEVRLLQSCGLEAADELNRCADLQLAVNGAMKRNGELQAEKAALEAQCAVMRQALTDLADGLGGCTCHEAYTSRKLRDPGCIYHG